jgi:osmoprotectant transport system ATP-binding protein
MVPHEPEDAFGGLSPPTTANRPAGPPHRAATVAFDHVTKRYGKHDDGPAAVDDLSFFVPAGATCVLVGPSGCGKTTSLKMVNRLIEPTQGRILIDGEEISTQDPTRLRRGIGYVIQQVGLFPHQTIGENVAVVPRLLGWSTRRRRERVDELLRLVGLEPAQYANRYPAELSGGERQRVGVARALAADPPLLLMDEPFGAVDPIVRARLQDELLRLQRELGKTILFVTHDIDEAIKMGDLVAVMRQGGTLAQFATPAELLTQPASDFVAQFVGADRALKRLTLRRVAELPLEPAPIVGLGESMGAVRARSGGRTPRWLLLVDRQRLPLGWVDASTLPDTAAVDAAAATRLSPLLGRETTVRDALSLLLDAAVRAGIVVDEAGRPVGLATIDAITALLHEQDGLTDEHDDRGAAAGRPDLSAGPTASGGRADGDTLPGGPSPRVPRG